MCSCEGNRPNYRSKTTGEWDISTILGSMITNDAICTCVIKSRIALARTTFKKKNKTFHLNLRNKLVMCYVWSRALYGGEFWTL
jgi:hypothetical protein